MNKEKIFFYCMALAIALRLLYVFLIPIGQNPDEVYIFHRIWIIANNLFSDRIYQNIYYPNNEFIYPPLFFFLMAVLLKIGSFVGVGRGDLASSFESAYIYLRLGTLIISCLAILIVGKTLNIFKINLAQRLSSFIFIVFLPSFIGFTSSFNHNTLLFLLISIFIYLVLKYESKISNARLWIILGSIAGLAALTKFEGIILFVFVPIYVTKVAKKNLRRLKVVLLFVISFVIFGGWWYLINLFKYGFFYDSQLFQASIAEYTRPFSFTGYIAELFTNTFQNFFITFGVFNNIRVSFIYYEILKIVIVIAILGLYKEKFKRIIKIFPSFRAVLFLFSILFFNLLIFLQWNLIYAYQSQGRYFFPSIVLISVLVNTGLTAISGVKNQMKLFLCLAILLIYLNLISIDCINFVFYDRSWFQNITGCVNF